MSYIGDDSMAAPILNRVRLAPKAARRLLEKLLYNIELMLATGWIHGDLSAFNILYWEDDVTIIDFPQVVNPRRNRSAYALLQRDVERVCAYFARQRASVDAATFTQDVWQRHYGRSRAELLADESRHLAQQRQDGSDATEERG
jgi:RIO kinase 1